MKILIKNGNSFLILWFLFSCLMGCKQHEHSAQSKSVILLNEIHTLVDSMVNDPERYANNFIFTMTHQRRADKDYIKISPAEYFNKDSVSTYEIYKEHLLVFYSNNFFKTELDKVDTVGLKSYMEWAYHDETTSMYHPPYTVIEIISDDTFRPLSFEEQIEKQLFNFGDRYVPEPEPNDFIDSE